PAAGVQPEYHRAPLAARPAILAGPGGRTVKIGAWFKRGYQDATAVSPLGSYPTFAAALPAPFTGLAAPPCRPSRARGGGRGGGGGGWRAARVGGGAGGGACGSWGGGGGEGRGRGAPVKGARAGSSACAPPPSTAGLNRCAASPVNGAGTWRRTCVDTNGC